MQKSLPNPKKSSTFVAEIHKTIIMPDYFNFYNNALEATWVVLGTLAFLLLGRSRQQPNKNPFLRSRSICGLSMLAFTIGLIIQWVFNPRIYAPAIGDMLLLAHFHIGGTIFALSHTTLLDPNILNRRRALIDLSGILTVQIFGWAGTMLHLPILRIFCYLALLCHICYVCSILWHTYYDVTRHIKNVSSDETERRLYWVAISGSSIILYGICNIILVLVLENNLLVNGIMSLITIPIFIYIYISYMAFTNDMPVISSVLTSTLENIKEEKQISKESVENSQTYNEVCLRIEQWIAQKGYLQEGITSQDLAEKMATNRVYVSHYFNSKGKSFRDTINELRIREAQEILKQPGKTVDEVAMEVGLPTKRFVRLYTEITGEKL